ncbi:MAG TPA: hypothetical protein VK027_00535, partial [Chitinophagaceae bacterium]|nr:hypothetical protein [Chitinophagaceae bacterium]
MSKEHQIQKIKTRTIVLPMILILLVIVGLMFALPTYKVWQQEMEGKAEMAKAEQNRKILIEEARAR